MRILPLLLIATCLLACEKEREELRAIWLSDSEETTPTKPPPANRVVNVDSGGDDASEPSEQVQIGEETISKDVARRLLESTERDRARDSVAARRKAKHGGLESTTAASWYVPPAKTVDLPRNNLGWPQTRTRVQLAEELGESNFDEVRPGEHAPRDLLDGKNRLPEYTNALGWEIRWAPNYRLPATAISIGEEAELEDGVRFSLRNETEQTLCIGPHVRLLTSDAEFVQESNVISALAPGDTRDYRHSYDELPAGWDSISTIVLYLFVHACRDDPAQQAAHRAAKADHEALDEWPNGPPPKNLRFASLARRMAAPPRGWTFALDAQTGPFPAPTPEQIEIAGLTRTDRGARWVVRHSFPSTPCLGYEARFKMFDGKELVATNVPTPLPPGKIRVHAPIAHGLYYAPEKVQTIAVEFEVAASCRGFR